MPTLDWDQVKNLFSDALLEAPSRRVNFVAAACNGDTDLRKEVLSLLDAHEGADQYFDDVFASFAGSAGIVGLEGKRLGAYRVLSLLGEGGMGSVYLAERADDQFEQRVAIKILHVPVAGEALLKRFKIEKQALAKLDHPNIARLLDAGVSQDGAPYLVMEYVDGQRIDHFCDSQRMSVADRLQLFTRVCDAVSFAHRHLIVHRDLKPPNVLVTEEGNVKLLDFGIARILSDDRDEGVSITTILDDRPMTPSYAAPEQWLRRGPTTMTDVFSLGAILGELLSGAQPFRRGDLDERRARPEHNIEPVRMAQRFGSGHDAHQPLTARDIAANRNASDAALRKLLRGDLQNIVSKAMAVKPEDRYPTADALRQDIENYLGRKPVIARAPGFLYLARKWLSRNKAPVAAVAAIMGLTVVTLVTNIQSARHSREQARQLGIERDKAAQVAALMTDVFSASDPSSERAAEITVREALNEGATRVISALDDQPQVKASLTGMIGHVYSNLNLYREAEAFLREALEGLGGIENIDNLNRTEQELVIETSRRLANAQVAQGEYDEAQSGLVSLRQVAADTLGTSHVSALRIVNSLTSVAHARRDIEHDQALTREAVAIANANQDFPFESRALAHNNRAAALYSIGRYEEAAARFRDVLKIQRTGLPENHTDILVVKSNLAAVYVTMNDDAAATDLYNQVISAGREQDVAPKTIAVALYGLGLLKLNSGNYGTGESLIAEAIEKQLVLKSEPDYEITLQRYMLGLAKQVNGDSAGAARAYRDALATAREEFPNRSLTARLMSHVAALALDAGDVSQAEDLNSQAEAIRAADDLAIPGHYAYTKAVSGRLAAHRGEIDKARALIREALALIEQTRGQKAPHAVIVRKWHSELESV